MKWFPIDRIFVLVAVMTAFCMKTMAAASDSLISAPQIQQTRRWDKREHLKYKGWERLKPTHVSLQYAGGMGMFSLGTGWDYGKRCQGETEIRWGFVPKKYMGDKMSMVFTLKENYIPWSVSFKERWSVEPFYCGLYITAITGNRFWWKEPDKYPGRYYKFSTRIRPYIFIGQRFGFSPSHDLLRKVSAYYEVGTCELYLISKFTNSSMKMKDILRFSFGVRMQLFRD